MGVKKLLYSLFLLMFITIVIAFPLQDYILYGDVTVDGTRLTKESSNVISLTMDGKELVRFTMGDVDADAYVFRVPMSDDGTYGTAQKGDSARIYVDGKEVDQSPVTIGDYGITVELDLTVGSGQSEEEQKDDITKKNSGGSSGGSRDREPEKESITITVTDEETEPVKGEIKEEKAVVTKTIEATKKIEKKVEQETEEEEIGVLQKLFNLLGFGKKAATGADVVGVPQPKPLIGILAALVIVAIGLAIAYFVIFKREEF